MEGSIKKRCCATMEVYNRQVELFPGYRRAQAAIEDDIHSLLSRNKSYRFSEAVIINVVVHILYHEDHQNIGDEQVTSQLEVLNKDFRARNNDKSQVPKVWIDLVADSFIQFRLASVDPKGKPTSGITRKQTEFIEFGPDNTVKDDHTGGKSPWPTDRYLNIWVCGLSQSILGYAQFPGGPADTDGVVIDYRAFGTTGTAVEPFNLGRTATHEIGHYLNLSHIFGDGRGNSCADTDFVPDTPNQLGPNYQKPLFPSISCDNGPNGDMFMNYMDYVDDASMFMFTNGQAARMNATLAGPRAGLLITQIENGNDDPGRS